jgi:hypothetical protein
MPTRRRAVAGWLAVHTVGHPLRRIVYAWFFVLWSELFYWLLERFVLDRCVCLGCSIVSVASLLQCLLQFLLYSAAKAALHMRLDSCCVCEPLSHANLSDKLLVQITGNHSPRNLSGYTIIGNAIAEPFLKGFLQARLNWIVHCHLHSHV